MDKVPANIVLFDGKCKLCNWTVLWISKRDRHGSFSLLPMKSRKGRDVLKRFGLPRDDLETLVYVAGNDYFIKSTAALRILRNLGWPHKIFYIFILVPKPIRDFVYDVIARIRYRFFGRDQKCTIKPDSSSTGSFSQL